MSFERYEVIRKAYAKLDESDKSTSTNNVSLDNIARVYDVNANPDVTSGKLSAE
jgi:hypothetical protein